MVEIINYPNPLLEDFNRLYPDREKWTAENVKAFIAERLNDPTNLQRLNSDGSVARASVKILYDDKTQGVFNSVLANDYAERRWRPLPAWSPLF